MIVADFRFNSIFTIMKKQILFLLMLCASLVLAGCSGSGSNNSKSETSQSSKSGKTQKAHQTSNDEEDYDEDDEDDEEEYEDEGEAYIEECQNADAAFKRGDYESAINTARIVLSNYQDADISAVLICANHSYRSMCKIIENKQDNMSDQTAEFLLNNAKLALRALKAVKSEDQEYYYDACEELSNRRNDWDYIITQLETKMIPYLN